MRMFCMITTKTTPGDTGGHMLLLYIIYYIILPPTFGASVEFIDECLALTLEC